MVATREFRTAADIEQALEGLEAHVKSVENFLEYASINLPDEYPYGEVHGALSDAAGCVRKAIEAQE